MRRRSMRRPRLQRLRADEDVLGDAEVGEERRLLEDDRDPGRLRLLGVVEDRPPRRRAAAGRCRAGGRRRGSSPASTCRRRSRPRARAPRRETARSQPSSSARTAPKLFWACSRTSSGSAGGAQRQSRWKISSSTKQALVGAAPFEPHEELAHLGLPARVHLGLLHRPNRCLEILALQIADHHPGVRDEERVVAPARLPRAPRASRARRQHAARDTRPFSRASPGAESTRAASCPRERPRGAATRRPLALRSRS